MSGHLTKPIIEEDLYDTIAGLLMAADNKPAPEAASVAEGGVECLPQTPTERLLTKFNGAEARLRRMGESFLRDFRTMPEDWDVVLAEGQAGEIADFVHRVKGVVGYFGYDELMALCGEIEQHGRQGGTAAAIANATRLRELMVAALEDLSAGLAGLQPVEKPVSVPRMAAAEFAELLRDTLPLVELGDFAARGQLEKLAAASAPESAQRLATAIALFDKLELEAAADLLDRLLQETHQAQEFGHG